MNKNFVSLVILFNLISLGNLKSYFKYQDIHQSVPNYTSTIYYPFCKYFVYQISNSNSNIHPLYTNSPQPFYFKESDLFNSL